MNGLQGAGSSGDSAISMYMQRTSVESVAVVFGILFILCLMCAIAYCYNMRKRYTQIVDTPPTTAPKNFKKSYPPRTPIPRPTMYDEPSLPFSFLFFTVGAISALLLKESVQRWRFRRAKIQPRSYVPAPFIVQQHLIRQV